MANTHHGMARLASVRLSIFAEIEAKPRAASTPAGNAAINATNPSDVIKTM
jgi:hypothetical protein